jgi:hypothetical protein
MYVFICDKKNDDPCENSNSFQIMINATDDRVWVTLSDFGCSVEIITGMIQGYAGAYYCFERLISSFSKLSEFFLWIFLCAVIFALSVFRLTTFKGLLDISPRKFFLTNLMILWQIAGTILFLSVIMT